MIAERLAADARDVARASATASARAVVGVEAGRRAGCSRRVIAIPFLRALDPRRTAASPPGPHDGAEPDHVVVLAVDPAFLAMVGLASSC